MYYSLISFVHNYNLERVRGVAWSSIRALGALDPSSNLGEPIPRFFFFKKKTLGVVQRRRHI